jgi:hypothetical protein
MATRIQVTIDCADPNRLARFWAEALGYRLVGAGATRLRVLSEEGVDHYAVVLQDPKATSSASPDRIGWRCAVTTPDWERRSRCL